MVTESRSAIARGHGDRRRLTAKLAGEVKMFRISVVVIALVCTKIHLNCMLKVGVFFGYVNYTLKKLI